MTAKELKKVLEDIDLSSLSDKELEQLYIVVGKFYAQIRRMISYIHYTDSKRSNYYFLRFFKKRRR